MMKYWDTIWRQKKDWILSLVVGGLALLFYLLYVGKDFIFYHDSTEYLWGAFDVHSNGYWGPNYTGFYPPVFLYFMNIYRWLAGGTYLEATLPAIMVMIFIFGVALSRYLKALELSSLGIFFASVILLSNSYLYTPAAKEAN